MTDIVYADDLCTPVVCELASELRGSVSAMTADTMDVLTPHALRPNLGPTKTSAVFAPIGPGSRAAHTEAFVHLKGRVPVWPESKGLHWLDLVPRYRHLGSLITYDGRMGPEIRHRLALAGSAYREGKRKLFSCKAIPLKKRAFLFKSHVLSVLLSGAGSWPLLAKGEWQTFAGGVLGLYRQLLCLRATGDWHHTASQIYAQVGLPSAEALLQGERLRLLGQLVCSAPDHVWALVSWNTEFRTGLSNACSWLFSHVGSTCDLGAVEDNWPAWHDFICARPGHWKGLIKRAEASDIERHKLSSVADRVVRTVWQHLTPRTPSPMADMEHACLLCGLAFCSQQQWGAHAQRKHGYRNSASKLAIGRTCRSCGMQYASQARLKTHLLASDRCRHHLLRLGPPGPEGADTGSGHVQAPSVRAVETAPVSAVGEELCLDLFDALRSSSCDDDQAIYDLVASYVAPLPMLRATLREWLSSLPVGALRSAAEDVLLVLKPDLLCSTVCGKMLGGSDDREFAPRIVPPLYCRQACHGPVVCVGSPHSEWLRGWQLSHLSQVQLEVACLSSRRGLCSGIFVAFPSPPLRGVHLLHPPSLSLRALRTLNAWTSNLLEILPPHFGRGC